MRPDLPGRLFKTGVDGLPNGGGPKAGGCGYLIANTKRSETAPIEARGETKLVTRGLGPGGKLRTKSRIGLERLSKVWRVYSSCTFFTRYGSRRLWKAHRALSV